MARYAELTEKLLRDAAGFFETLAEQNEPLKEQMLENANVFRQIGHMFGADPGGKLDDTPLAELAGKLLSDAAAFFVSLGENKAELRDQMEENANVFSQMAKLIAEDPHGALPDGAPSGANLKPRAGAVDTADSKIKTPTKANETAQKAGDTKAAPAPKTNAAKPVPEAPAPKAKAATPVFEKMARNAVAGKSASAPTAQRTTRGSGASVSGTVKRKTAPAKPPAPQDTAKTDFLGLPRKTPPKAAPARSAKDATPAPPAHPDRDPLSPRNVRLNGHVDRIDPVFGLSFPTDARPRPITSIWAENTYAKKRAAVFGRANHVCRYCGLRSKKYQQTVGPHDAHTNSQAHCACIMCAQVMALDQVSPMRAGVLIHLPEMGQAELNVIARIIYVCRISQGPNADFARHALGRFIARRDAARAAYGSDDPAVLTRRLAEAPDRAAYSAEIARTADLRLFPLDRRVVREADLEFNQFPQILAYWRSKDGPFGGLTPPQMELGAFRARIEGIFGEISMPDEVKD